MVVPTPDFAGIQVARRFVLRCTPSPFASLAVLASLRNGSQQVYVHDGLAERLGEDLVGGILADLHAQVFTEWLTTPLKVQKLAVKQQLRRASAGRPPIADAPVNSFRDLIPDSAELPERQLFECDLSIVLKLLKAEKSDLLAASASSLWRTALALQRVKVSDSDKGLTLSDLSAALGVSSNHLGRVFHQQSGISFRKYLLAARMFRAATLLRSSPLALKQVASTLGYSDESNFCRDFRKAFGKSAISYRLQPSVREELQVSSLA